MRGNSSYLKLPENRPTRQKLYSICRETSGKFSCNVLQPFLKPVIPNRLNHNVQGNSERHLHRITRTSMLDLAMNFFTFQRSSAQNLHLRFQAYDLNDNYVIKLPSLQQTSGNSNEIRKPFVKSFVKRTVISISYLERLFDAFILLHI